MTRTELKAAPVPLPGVSAAAVFLPAGLPREGKVAFWDPAGGPPPQAAAARSPS